MKIFEANNAALRIWTKATGLDPKKPEILGSFYEYHRNIRQSQDIDPTALTTFMILRSTVRDYAAQQEFDALELLEHPNKVLKRTEDLRKLLEVLNDPECMAEVKEFQERLRKSAEEMGLEKTVKKTIADIQELAYIRRDALLGFKELKVHHFGHGKRGPAKPKYNENVIKFWNMNSVIQAAQIQPEDGISMVMVRDPVDLYSYFCFLVVHGANITVVSDLPDEPHPMHKYMSRSRAQVRRFEDRALRLRFPYQLFDFTFSDDGKDYTGEKTKTGLARTSSKAVVVKPIKDLDPDQALWAMLMFELLAEQYWNQEQQPVALSYTGDGMHQAGNGTSKGLIVPGQALLAPLTREDVHRDKLASVFEYAPTGQNDWMEDRYGRMVPEQVFNLIGKDDIFRLLDGSAKPKKSVPETKDVGPILNTGTIGWVNKSWELKAVEPTLFGTPEKMESDRRFIARFNQAVVIEAEATKEFNARKDEVCKWFEERVKGNLERLLHQTAIGSFESEIQGYPPSKKGEISIGFDNGVPQRGNILWQRVKVNGIPYYSCEVKLYSAKPRYEKYLCYLSGKGASVWSYFRPMTPKSLADLAGCRVEDLPDVLQYWYRNERYCGNEILDRTDPMDWKCTNPWRSIEFDVLLGLAKSEFNRLLKKYGLPRREITSPKG